MTKPTSGRVILGSGSPRRAALMAAFGVACEVAAADIDESDHGTVADVARAKLDALAPRYPGRTILTADTLVLRGAAQLGKPRDLDHARKMIRACSGQTIAVVSGVCVLQRGIVTTREITSRVPIRVLSAHDVECYLATGTAADKAGGLALQAEARHFVDRGAGGLLSTCEEGGCYSNVVGLPMCAVAELLDREPQPQLCRWPEMAPFV